MIRRPQLLRARALLGAALALGACSAPAAPPRSTGSTASPAPAPPEPERYACPRAAAPPPIDGRIDAAWDAAPWTADFVDIEGPGAPVPRLRTRAKMLWDDACFYVAAELEEPDVCGALTERDSVVYHDNDFEVFLDPDGDGELYAELELNALGTEWDLVLVRPYRDGGPALDGWDMRGLRTAVRVDGTLNAPGDRDRGWTVEISIPWRALDELTRAAAPPAPGDVWHVNFSRVQWRHDVRDGRYAKRTDPLPRTGRPEDNWVWSPQGAIDMHAPERWGRVQFSGGARSGE